MVEDQVPLVGRIGVARERTGPHSYCSRSVRAWDCGPAGPPSPGFPRRSCDALSCDGVLLRGRGSSIATEWQRRAGHPVQGYGCRSSFQRRMAGSSRLVLVAQDAERRGAEHEAARVARRQAHPARGQDAEEVAVAEEQDAARRSAAGARSRGRRGRRRPRPTRRPGQPSRNRDQPGRSLRISAVVRPSYSP